MIGKNAPRKGNPGLAAPEGARVIGHHEHEGTEGEWADECAPCDATTPCNVHAGSLDKDVVHDSWGQEHLGSIVAPWGHVDQGQGFTAEGQRRPGPMTVFLMITIGPADTGRARRVFSDYELKFATKPAASVNMGSPCAPMPPSLILKFRPEPNPS